jgi:hypothetical protein
LFEKAPISDMNVSWILAGTIALVTGIGRSFAFFANLKKSLLPTSVPEPIVAWFPIVWFIVSGLFVFSAIVFFVIGLRPTKFAGTQIAMLLSGFFLLVWIIIASGNIWSIHSSTLRPLYPIAIIVVLGFYGIYQQKKKLA